MYHENSDISTTKINYDYNNDNDNDNNYNNNYYKYNNHMPYYI